MADLFDGAISAEEDAALREQAQGDLDAYVGLVLDLYVKKGLLLYRGRDAAGDEIYVRPHLQ